MKTSQIKTRAPFNELFPINPSILSAIKARIDAHGYDESQAIVIWDEEGVVVDGHMGTESIFLEKLMQLRQIRQGLD